MLNKPYIHYIDIKIMNNLSRRCNWTDTIIRQQEVQLDCSYNDNFIKMLIWTLLTKASFIKGVLNL
jgi:hypothetical protein